MTLNDLRDEVAALAFEDGITLDKSFIASANRALITLFTERPAAKCVRIITHEQKPILHIPHMTHAASKDITINLSGIAYAFRVSGKGSFRVEDGISVTLKDFDTESSLFRGKLRNSDAKITFGGNFLYNVYSLVCYSDLYSDDEGDIREYEEYSKYDLDRLFGDFLTFLEPPTIVILVGVGVYMREYRHQKIELIARHIGDDKWHHLPDRILGEANASSLGIGAVAKHKRKRKNISLTVIHSGKKHLVTVGKRNRRALIKSITQT